MIFLLYTGSADVLSERHFVRTSLDVLSGQPLRFCQQKLAKIRKNEQKDQKKQKEAKISKMDKEEQEGACPEIKNLKGGPDKSSFCQMSKPVRLKKMSHKTGLTKRLSDKTSKGGFQKLLSGFFPLRGYPPPPTPLTENNFAKNPLAEMGGTPPP